MPLLEEWEHINSCNKSNLLHLVITGDKLELCQGSYNKNNNQGIKKIYTIRKRTFEAHLYVLTEYMRLLFELRGYFGIEIRIYPFEDEKQDLKALKNQLRANKALSSKYNNRFESYKEGLKTTLFPELGADDQKVVDNFLAKKDKVEKRIDILNNKIKGINN